MMEKLIFLSLLFISCALAANFKTIDVNITSKDDADIIHSWDLDVWSNEGSLVLGSNNIRVTEDDMKRFDDLNIQYSVVVEDVAQYLADAERNHSKIARACTDPYFCQYQTLASFQAYLYSKATANPSVMKRISIGNSLEGRAMYAYIITGNNTVTKKKIFLSGSQHAREWISSAALIRFIDQLVNTYNSLGSGYANYLGKTAYYIIPMMNPDGYEYSRITDRMWRKNRRGGYGVDLNRNWNAPYWCQLGGASSSQSAIDYCGTAPFSEPETLNAKNFATTYGPFDATIDFHSYTQLVLRQSSYTPALVPNEAEQKLIGDMLAYYVSGFYTAQYTSKTGYQLYITTGTIQEYFYHNTPTKLSFAIELPPLNDPPGFLLPPDQIIPVGGHVFLFAQILASYLSNNYNVYVNNVFTFLNIWADGSNSQNYNMEYTGMYHSAGASIQFLPANNEYVRFVGSVDTNKYMGILFWINGGTWGGQGNLVFEVTQKSVYPYPITFPVTASTTDIAAQVPGGGGIPQNKWVQVYIPFNFPQGVYNGFQFRDTSGTFLWTKTLYIDDITLVGRI